RRRAEPARPRLGLPRAEEPGPVAGRALRGGRRFLLTPAPTRGEALARSPWCFQEICVDVCARGYRCRPGEASMRCAIFAATGGPCNTGQALPPLQPGTAESAGRP